MSDSYRENEIKTNHKFDAFQQFQNKFVYFSTFCDFVSVFKNNSMSHPEWKYVVLLLFSRVLWLYGLKINAFGD